MKRIIIAAFLISLLPFSANARSNINTWYIKDFKTEIVVEEDSSLLITEKITADCGLSRRHGIFRVLPITMTTINEEEVITPIDLISITDFEGNPHKYQTIRDAFYGTITWKIGDENVYVTGENYYKIKYRVHNVIHDDTLHWNLLGSFWDLEIDNFEAEIIFPKNVFIENEDISYYGGLLGEKRQDTASYKITEDNSAVFSSERGFKRKEGLTASIKLPEGRFSFNPSFLMLLRIYGSYLFFLFPIITLLISFSLWKKHGKAYEHKGHIRQFSGPEGVSPALAALIYQNKKFTPNIIAGTIINLAVTGFLKIEEEEKKILLLNKKETYLERLKKEDPTCEIEKLIINGLFNGKERISLKEIRESFSKRFLEIKEKSKKLLLDENFFYKKSSQLKTINLVISIIFLVGGFFSFFALNLFFGANLFVSGAILFFFGLISQKRTKKGLEICLHMKGLREYMNTAEKERQIFYEEEGIFEKLLPYAIIFNMTKRWIKKVESIRGEEYLLGYHPVWYTGSSMQSFNVTSLTSTISGISSQVSSGTSGGAGGGGGGGGGGGW